VYFPQGNLSSHDADHLPDIRSLVAVGLLVSGMFYFRRMEKTFADLV
jgi:ABC-type polysaccharide/polyol phosphate export permease